MNELIELTASELDLVAGGQQLAANVNVAAILQRNSSRVGIGNDATVTAGANSSVAIGNGNSVDVDQSNSNSGNATATATQSASA